jgi:hypothetical protein
MTSSVTAQGLSGMNPTPAGLSGMNPTPTEIEEQVE